MAKLQLNHVKKTFDGKTYSVKDFNLDIMERDFIVLVGPSGCGKSTTLRMIAGLESISEGELLIDGKVANQTEPKNRNIAMVFQNYALYPHLTVEDNIGYGLKVKKEKKSEIKNKVHQATELLDLVDYLNKKPGELSGGQRQRVALGRAIVRDADFFLMDEPLSNLDAKLRVVMRSEIIQLHKRLNTTTIYVTHDQIEAMTMATKIVVMNKGEIQQIGTPKEVYNSPNNTFVASFIGSPSMNLLKCQYENGKLFVNDTDDVIDLNESQKELLAKLDTNQITLGIRPEKVEIAEEHDNKRPIIHSSVEVSEFHGSETIVFSNINGFMFAAKTKGDNIYDNNAAINYTFDINDLYFFETRTGENITIKMK